MQLEFYSLAHDGQAPIALASSDTFNATWGPLDGLFPASSTYFDVICCESVPTPTTPYLYTYINASLAMPYSVFKDNSENTFSVEMDIASLLQSQHNATGVQLLEMSALDGDVNSTLIEMMVEFDNEGAV